MKIADKKTMIIQFLNTILTDIGDKYYLVNPEFSGSLELNVGNKNKKKYQYAKGELAIPHIMLNEENKENFEVADRTFGTCTSYAFMKKEFASDQMKKQIKETEDALGDFFKTNPEVEIKLNELFKVLKDATY